MSLAQFATRRKVTTTSKNGQLKKKSGVGRKGVNLKFSASKSEDKLIHKTVARVLEAAHLYPAAKVVKPRIVKDGRGEVAVVSVSKKLTNKLILEVGCRWVVRGQGDGDFQVFQVVDGAADIAAKAPIPEMYSVSLVCVLGKGLSVGKLTGAVSFFHKGMYPRVAEQDLLESASNFPKSWRCPVDMNAFQLLTKSTMMGRLNQ
jgi:hypothetical protein